jgi:hypothetical protein
MLIDKNIQKKGETTFNKVFFHIFVLFKKEIINKKIHV